MKLQRVGILILVSLCTRAAWAAPEFYGGGGRDIQGSEWTVSGGMGLRRDRSLQLLAEVSRELHQRNSLDSEDKTSVLVGVRLGGRRGSGISPYGVLMAGYFRMRPASGASLQLGAGVRRSVVDGLDVFVEARLATAVTTGSGGLGDWLEVPVRFGLVWRP
jgi:hypothetical protein